MGQTLLVGLIVGVCAAYAGWALLLPAAARRAVVGSLLRLPLPGALARRLRVLRSMPSGCHCDGYGVRPANGAVPTATQTVHWAPRRRR